MLRLRKSSRSYQTLTSSLTPWLYRHIESALISDLERGLRKTRWEMADREQVGHSDRETITALFAGSLHSRSIHSSAVSTWIGVVSRTGKPAAVGSRRINESSVPPIIRPSTLSRRF